MDSSMLKIADESKVHGNSTDSTTQGSWLVARAGCPGCVLVEVAPLLGLISCTWMQPDAGPGPPRTT